MSGTTWQLGQQGQRNQQQYLRYRQGGIYTIQRNPANYGSGSSSQAAIGAVVGAALGGAVGGQPARCSGRSSAGCSSSDR